MAARPSSSSACCFFCSTFLSDFSRSLCVRFYLLLSGRLTLQRVSYFLLSRLQWTNRTRFAILGSMRPALIVHGGAWDIPDEAVDGCKSGCQRALAAGWSILSKGGKALDAIEAAVIVLEDDPVFDAGYGSHLNLDGRVECDAMVMDGATLRAGAAATLQRVKNPIRLARAILDNCPHMMLVAKGAERFATEQGIALCKPRDLISEAERQAILGETATRIFRIDCGCEMGRPDTQMRSGER